jgi:hypothetical protein
MEEARDPQFEIPACPYDIRHSVRLDTPPIL